MLRCAIVALLLCLISIVPDTNRSHAQGRLENRPIPSVEILFVVRGRRQVQSPIDDTYVLIPGDKIVIRHFVPPAYEYRQIDRPRMVYLTFNHAGTRKSGGRWGKEIHDLLHTNSSHETRIIFPVIKEWIKDRCGKTYDVRAVVSSSRKAGRFKRSEIHPGRDRIRVVFDCGRPWLVVSPIKQRAGDSSRGISDCLLKGVEAFLVPVVVSDDIGVRRISVQLRKDGRVKSQRNEEMSGLTRSVRETLTLPVPDDFTDPAVATKFAIRILSVDVSGRSSERTLEFEKGLCFFTVQ